MAFLYSFFIGGILVALGQLVKELKVPFPVAIVAFIILGGVLTPLGVMGPLSEMAPGGVNLLPIGLGNAAYSTGAALGAGAPEGIIMVVGLIILLLVMGSVSGINKKLPAPPDEAAGQGDETAENDVK